MKSRELLYKNIRHLFYHVLQCGIFFQSLLAVTDQGRILSGSVVVGVYMCSCIHVHTHVDEKLYQSYSVLQKSF